MWPAPSSGVGPCEWCESRMRLPEAGGGDIKVDAMAEVRAVKTIRGEEMHHARANKLVQAWLAGNGRESCFQEASLGPRLHYWSQALGT